MWKVKCCEQNPSIDSKLKRLVELYFKELKVYTTADGEQKSTYGAGNLVKRKLCYIKDRSTASQETSITNGRVDPSSSKELIFNYFDITDLKTNEIRWEGMSMVILGVNKISSTVIEGKRYNAPDKLPYISIIVGVNKL